MNWKNCLLVFTIIDSLLAFMGYLIFTTFVLPVFAECEFIGQYYEESPINLSLAEWIFGNMIAGIIVFCFCTLSKSKSKDCAFGILLLVVGLYCLFEVAWNIIGFMVFNDHYKDACASSGPFNTYITVALYYGIIAFPLIVIVSIVGIIQMATDGGQSQAEVSHQQISQDIVASLNQPDVPAKKHSDFYSRLSQRISASFRQNPNSIN